MLNVCIKAPPVARLNEEPERSGAGVSQDQ